MYSGIVVAADLQSCQPLRFGHSLLHPRALHYTHDHITTLSPPKKIYFYFQSCACMWASNAPAPATRCACPSVLVLNQLTNHRVWFNSCSYMSVPGETTFIFTHSKLPCHSEKLKASSWVINVIRNLPTKLSGKNISTEKFLCIVRSA